MRATILPICLLLGLSLATPCTGGEPTGILPVIYSTDLLHPHDDPDDHFDLAVLFALSDVRLEAVILDQGQQQETRPGDVALIQLNRICGRNVPWAHGLAQTLSGPEDTGSTQPEADQKGVRLMLAVLERATTQVTVVCVGSLRDTAAAFNRAPELFRAKVSRLVVFAGEARANFQEYNVGLDPHAYVRIMTSGLPIYWVPCFDGGLWHNNGHASYWVADHRDLLTSASPRLMNFFIYALVDKGTSDPLACLEQPVNACKRERLLAERRNLWGAAIFAYLAGYRIVAENGVYVVRPAAETAPEAEVRVFDFEPVNVRIDSRGIAYYDGAPGCCRVMRFRVLQPERYGSVLTSVSAGLLSSLGR